MILVTGGTGLVGSHLLWELIQQRENKIKATYRTRDSIGPVKDLFVWNAELDGRSAEVETQFNKIEWVRADITDIPRLTSAFENVDYVYHCAALISFNPKRFKRLEKINVEGTANMVNLSIKNGIKKFCYVSSVAALGKSKDLVTESSQWEPADENSVYSISKFAAEMEVWRGTQEGLDSVIVNPGIILGEGFYNSGSGVFFKQVKKGMKYSIPGATGFVDVKDVVRAMLALMNSEVVQERFILVGHNEPFESVFEKIASAVKGKMPSKKLKPWQLEIAWRLDKMASWFGKKQKLFRSTARSAYQKVLFSNDKLKNTLDFEYTPLDESIKRIAIHFNRQRPQE